MSDIITGDDILGKEVLDNFGRKIGVVMKLHIDREKRFLTGISIDRGFVSSDIFIGSDFIKTFGVDVIILSKSPAFTYEGSKVYREDGKYVGKIEEVTLNRLKQIDTLLVNTDNSILKNKTITILRKDIRTIGLSIILKKGFEIN